MLFNEINYKMFGLLPICSLVYSLDQKHMQSTAALLVIKGLKSIEQNHHSVALVPLSLPLGLNEKVTYHGP